MHYAINCCIVKTIMLQTTQVFLILMKNEQEWKLWLEIFGCLINQEQNLSKHQLKWIFCLKKEKGDRKTWHSTLNLKIKGYNSLI